MFIQNSTQNHSGNWIVASETKPELKENILIVQNTTWKTNNGRAEIDTIIVLNDSDLTSLLVGYRFTSRNYRGGSQYWKHYKNGKQVTWKQLDDADRLRILDKEIPSWANIPGKITLYYDNNPKNPHRQIEHDNAGAIIGYKYLTADIEGFHSLHGDCALWLNNSLDADELPQENNTNGIYAAKTFDSPILGQYKNDNRRLVKLMLSGKVLEFTYGFRSEHADILEVIE